MTELLAEQISLQGRIARSFSNFKKDGAAKMMLNKCKTRSDNLDKTWTRFETNHYLIINDNSDAIKESSYILDKVFEETEEIYLDIKAEFKTFLDSLMKQNTIPGVAQGVSEDFERLPRISIPKFKGDFCQWESFRDLFTSLVIEKPNNSNVTKLHHLKTSLEGDAARTISSFAIRAENFDIAWKKLNERYENKRRLEVSSNAQDKTEVHEQNAHFAVNSSANVSKVTHMVLLTTAVVKIISDKDKIGLVRALIDQGSQSSFITESLLQRLNLRYERVYIPITGICAKKNYTCRKMVHISLKPRFDSEFCVEVRAFVLPKIASYSPRLNTDLNDYDHIRNLNLADPKFHSNGSIELLLGASVYAEILEGTIIRGKVDEPIAINTSLGWLLSGSVGTVVNFSLPSILHVSEHEDINELLQKFWTQEEISLENLPTPNEAESENHFLTTHSRDSLGRYMVRLPFKTENPSGLEFPGSFEFARRMLLSLEKKFESNFDFRRLYIDFMVDYVKSGHMREVKLNEVEKVKYFLPHHGVLKNVGNNLKLRTVFNGSARALNGSSLNDTLNSGANLLPDLSSLILRWMKYPLVFVTDVKQMFRQIRVHSEDQFYQAILWRFDPSEEIKIWLLETVTYGLICSPYLAIRVTRKLAEDEYHNFPLGAEILNREMFMDDATSGGYTLEEALRKQIELINFCKVGGFELHKWVANDARLHKDLSVPHAEDDTGLSFSVLGLKWNAGADYFHFDIQTPPIIYDEIFITKRFVLSKIAKLFDPLGWIAPVIINFKIFIQKLWLNKFDWDEELPSDLAKQFIECFNDLGCISEVKIDRWLGYKPGALSYEIHGFADASKVAYGAVVYLRVIYDNQVNVHLLQAKTKVAPLKPLLTIPRLELSAAVLLVKLVRKVCDAIAIENCTVNLWSDSTDVLFWLRDHPSRWPTFIANRCSIVHTVMPSAVWRHVSSSVNPADCASRGLKASDLCDFELWWKGPKFLRESFEPFQIPINSDPTSDPAIEVNCLVHSGEQEGKHGVWNLVGRRGSCSDLYSDQDTTFVGADRELRDLYKRSSPFVNDLTNKLVNEGTKWHFNPPAAPHFGGIWEAAVKSTKHHLRRVIGAHKLTFEEFYTLLTQYQNPLT
ncbi:uncharacterized protein LOC123318300 [Coccinella septempunctata]|uniref:uncharacterized protein LOC123318300 n=1 Tax=Coccinella septempunctata TaxID=41139 RepID=UPI001D06C3E7|nr:uncharacterized protein LOC123318300 [Coccinella septempunctata]